jgi:REP element-mobilizing transposase RayT
MARGVDKREIFVDDQDRHEFLGAIVRLKSQTPCSILAYCLMGNHFHLAIRVGSAPLSQIMQRLLTTYVLGFNARHTREGHLFQARYKSRLCLDDAYLISLIRYIHMNPVRAGLVANPGDWRWSSHRIYSERVASPLADAHLFFAAAGSNIQDYESWSANADEGFKPWPEIGMASPLLREEADEPPSLDELASKLFPEDAADLQSGGRKRTLSWKKSILATEALKSGYSLVSIAAWMGCTPAAIHHLLYRHK